MSNRNVRKAKAQVIAELQRIYAEHDGLRASVVVEEARSKKSPLHDEFEWDDGKAAHEFRLLQARRLIRLTVPELDGKPNPFIHVPAIATKNEPGLEGVYRPLHVVVENADWFARALGELAAKVRAAQAAAEQLREAASAHDNPDSERMARIAMAITALQTAGAAVSALH